MNTLFVFAKLLNESGECYSGLINNYKFQNIHPQDIEKVKQKASMLNDA